ncbi:MAG: tRNA threonylcarbamoyladenosine dehydratase [Oscillospiraceae bacterium]|nr:tRNA threonylcarbamoyladenosine dehydratase [Oscillospiraceae bacterium]
MSQSQFLRTEMLLGSAAMEALRRAHVAVVGIGGVGAYAAETLARAGIGTLTFVDQDTVGESNLNRQLIALHSTIGRPKAEVMAERALDINPNCHVAAMVYRYEPDTAEEFWACGPFDYVVDAIDLVSCKLHLIETAVKRDIPVISALGTGNKLDASRLQIADIAETSGCPLARVVRKELRRRGIEHHKVVFSPEEAHESDQSHEAPPPGRRSIPASVPWVPAVAGLLLGSAVVRDLTGI